MTTLDEVVSHYCSQVNHAMVLIVNAIRTIHAVPLLAIKADLEKARDLIRDATEGGIWTVSEPGDAIAPGVVPGRIVMARVSLATTTMLYPGLVVHRSAIENRAIVAVCDCQGWNQPRTYEISDGPRAEGGFCWLPR